MTDMQRNRATWSYLGRIMLTIILMLSSWGLLTQTATAQTTLEQQLTQPALPTPSKRTTVSADDVAMMKQLYQKVQKLTPKLKRLQFLKKQPTTRKSRSQNAYAGFKFNLAEVRKNGVNYPHNLFWPEYTWIELDQAIDPEFWDQIMYDDEPMYETEFTEQIANYVQDVDLVTTTYGNQMYGDLVYQSYYDSLDDPSLLTPENVAAGVPSATAFQTWMLGSFAKFDLKQISAQELYDDYWTHHEYLELYEEFGMALGNVEDFVNQVDTIMSIIDTPEADQYFIQPMLDSAYAILMHDYSREELASLDAEATFAAETEKYHAPALDIITAQHQGATWLTMSALGYVPTYVMNNPAALAQPVTINYVDQNDKQIAASKQITGNIDDPYDAMTSEYQPAIDGHTLDKTKLPTNGKGTLTAEPVTVTYVYTRDSVAAAPVTVKHQDETGEDLVEPETITGNIGDSYTTKAKTIDNYTFQTVTGAVSGTLSATPQTVVYTYAPNPIAGAPVTVHHHDEAGKSLVPSETLTGMVGEVHQTKAQTIDGYAFKSVEGNPIVTISDQPQTVTYTYTPLAVAAGTVTITYLDEAGHELAPATILTGSVGDDFESAPLTLTGYTLQPDSATVKGTFTTEAQQFSYQYTKDTEPATDGEVLVWYVDQNDQQVAAPETLTGKLGDAYTTAAKSIADYQLVKTTGPTSGQFTATLQTVTYVYQPVKEPVATGKVVVQHHDVDGQRLADDVTLTGAVGSTYQTTLKSIDGYTYQKVTGSPSGQFTSVVQTVTYVYEKDPVAVAQGHVTIKYQDMDGKTLQPDTELVGDVGTDYSTTAAKIKGYQWQAVVGHAKGTFKATAQTVTYRYQPVTTTQSDDEVNNGSKPDTTKPATTKPNSDKTTAQDDTIKPTATKTTTTQPTTTNTTPLKSAAAPVLKAPATSGNLPQANEQRSSWVMLIGTGLLACLGYGYYWLRRRQ